MIRPVTCFKRLLRLCRERGRSLEDSEDLIQEALLRLQEYQLKATVSNPDEFLARAVRNLVIDEYRRQRIVSYEPQPVEELADRLFLADAAPSPENIVDSCQQLDEIKRKLKSVSERVQQVYFYSMAGYKQKEIANIFGISLPTVEKDLSKALLALMKK